MPSRFSISTLLLLLSANLLAQPDSLIQHLSNANSNEQRIETKLALSDHYSGSKPDSSSFWVRQVLADSNYCAPLQLRKAFKLLGYSFYDTDNYKQALREFEKGITFARIEGNNQELVKLMALVSDCNRYLGKSDQAFQVAFDGLKIAESGKDYDQMGKMNSRIGELYRDRGDYHKAISYLQTSYDCFNKAGIERGMLVSKVNLALAYKNVDPNVALNTYVELIEEFNHLFSTYDSARVYSNLANIYLQLDEYDNAESALKQALILHQSIDKKVSLGYCYKELGELYILINKPELATLNAALALEKAEQTDHLLLQVQSIKLLADAHQRLGEYKRANLYLNQHMALKDSLINREKLELSKRLEKQYETDKKEQQILFQNEQIARQEAEINEDLTIRNALFIVLVLILFIGVVLYRNYRSLKRKNKEIEEMHLRQTRWFANIAHELSTPLSLILLPIKNLLGETRLSPQAKDMLRLAKKYSDLLESRVREIVDLSHMSSSNLQLTSQISSVNVLVQDVVDSFQLSAAENNIALTFEFNAMDIHLDLDKDRVQKIIGNLISNAIKFTPKNGRIKVSVYLDEESQDVNVAVQDNGIGISEVDLPKIFDRFFQSSHKNPNLYAGSGIGLTLSQEIAHAHGGRITASSEIGNGSIFTLILPSTLRASSPLEQDLNLSIEPKSELNPSAQSQVDKARILLVEDHHDMRKFISNLLAPMYDIVEAGDGEEGLQQLQNTPVDLIISDVKMPNMDGLTFASRVKKMETHRLTPFIHLTAHSNEEDKLSALRIGVDDYLAKPFDHEELLVRIKNLIQNSLERKMAWDQSPDTHREPSQEEIVLKQLEAIVLDQIHDSTFSVERLAKESAMSVASLNRLLKRTTGYTPGNYIREIRLQLAMDYLVQRKYTSIKEVVYAVGFENVSSFSRLFKKRFGRSPSNYSS